MRRCLFTASLLLPALALCAGAQPVAAERSAAQVCFSEAATRSTHAAALRALDGSAGSNGAAAVAGEWQALAHRHGAQEWQARCVDTRFEASIVGEVCRTTQDYNAWCALVAPDSLARGIRLSSAANVMFEDRDRICEQLAGEHSRLSTAAHDHSPRAREEAAAALSQAQALAARASQAGPEQREALYGEFAVAMGRHTRARFESEYGPGEQGYRLLELQQAADWDACRRHSPHAAIPRWRHMDELQWCRDEYDHYDAMRMRLNTDSAWLTDEYASISLGGAPPARIETYSLRSQEYHSLSAEYGAQLAHYDRRCTGYRTSPTFAVAVCRDREDGFCRL